MMQLEINLEAETEIDIKLAAGDKVDGYFYIVKGDNITFSISGSSLIYASKAPVTQGQSVASDRFSFTASQAQGGGYTLKFNVINGNSKDKNSATVFLEFIYPAAGTVLVPIGTK
jgi:hypothetical protein